MQQEKQQEVIKEQLIKEEKESETQINNNNTNKKGSKLVYFFICLSNIFINVDHGIIPAATDQIKQYLKVGDAELGLLGSFVYFGIISAGFFAGKLYLKYRSKIIVLISFVFMILILYCFTLFDTIYPLYFIRFLTGVSQVFLLVYFPVWVDLFGGDIKTIWLTILQIGVPLGVFFGYALTAAISKVLSWQWAFYIQCMGCGLPFLFFVFLQNEKMETNLRQQELDLQKNQQQTQQALDNKNNQQEGEVHLIDEQIFEQERKQSIPLTYPSLLEVENEKKEKQIQINYYSLGFFALLKILWKSQLYVVAMLTITLLYFVVTGIQFWMSDYFKVVLKVDEYTVLLGYSIISLTAPTLGVLFGGIATQKCGGYESLQAKKLSLVLAIISALVATPAPFFDRFIYASISIWCLLFFGGAMVPGLTGMMLSAVEPELRGFANSNSQTVQSLLGYLPAPFLYGLLNTYVGKRAGMFMIMYSTILGVFLSSYGLYLGYKIEQKKKGKKVEKKKTLSKDKKVVEEEDEDSEMFGATVKNSINFQNKKKSSKENQIKDYNPIEETASKHEEEEHLRSGVHNILKISQQELIKKRKESQILLQGTPQISIVQPFFKKNSDYDIK